MVTRAGPWRGVSSAIWRQHVYSDLTGVTCSSAPTGHPAPARTRAYVERHTRESLSKKETIPCRYLAREVYRNLSPDPGDHRDQGERGAGEEPFHRSGLPPVGPFLCLHEPSFSVAPGTVIPTPLEVPRVFWEPSCASIHTVIVPRTGVGCHPQSGEPPRVISAGRRSGALTAVGDLGRDPPG